MFEKCGRGEQVQSSKFDRYACVWGFLVQIEMLKYMCFKFKDSDYQSDIEGLMEMLFVTYH